MSVYILGISAFYHDSAACLIKDGEIIAAAQEERFTRKKHDFGFPIQAISYCLKEARVSPSDLNFVAYYEKPFVKFERILETYLAYAPLGLRSFLKAIPAWIKQKLWISEVIRKELNNYKGKIIFSEHHASHAASAFYPSPFDQAAILTIDGVGEWATTSIGAGKGNYFELMFEQRFPHSLGLLYSAFTYYTGFRVNSGEYKVMGLAPYGEPKYADLIQEKLVDLKEDGSFRLNMRYFNYCAGLTMTNKKFDELLGGPPRAPETKLTQKEMDIAASIQVVTEKIMVNMAKYAQKVTGEKNLCLAGGVALNCVGNGKIIKESSFKKIWIQPAAGDAGGALGAALFVWYHYLGNDRNTRRDQQDFQKGSYLGPQFSDEEIESFLIKSQISHKKLAADQLPVIVADLIDDQKVIGWFEGRMEFGPRALGARSILGDARSPEMQALMNLKIKFREGFRPFAPSVLREKAPDYFDINCESPYMLITAPIKSAKRKNLTLEEQAMRGIDGLKVVRSEIPAVTHVDFSARMQTVSKESNPLYHRLINAFYRKTGCPVIINTSFNVRGEPIVCTPEDAYRCFMRTNMDYLVMGSFLIDKSKQEKQKMSDKAAGALALD